MKKLKLSRSKDPDVKQPKISNFFTFSKDKLPNPANLNEGQKKDTVHKTGKTIQLKHEVKKNINSNRPPGRKLCIKCLQKSPSNESGFCNVCNLSETKPNDLVKLKNTDKDLTDVFGISEQTSLGSPDVIPPTPPVALKSKKVGKSIDKSVKRKFNFEDSTNMKKKCVSNDESQNISQPSDLKNIISEIGFKHISPSEGKENFQSVTNKNPFRTNSLGASQPILDTDCKYNTSEMVGNDNLTKHCEIKTNSYKFESDLIIINSSRNGEPNTELYSNSSDITHIPDNDCKEDGISKPESKCSLDHVNPSDMPVCDNDKQLPLPSKCINQSVDVDTSFLDDFSFDETIFNEPIRLDDGVRCKVMSVEHLESCGELLLGLKPCDISSNTDPVTCVLRGSWASSDVNEGETVSVTARPVSGQINCWVVDNDYGLLVVHPDTLVSGTAIVGSLFCMRRSVLSDMYRGMDSDSPIMVLGSFLHELLQEVLKKKVSSLQGIKEVLIDFTSTRHFMFSLYSSGMSVDKTKETLHEFVPKIHAFLQKYIEPDSKMCEANIWNEGESWNGTITDIADIEENIWAPKLGIKGKVDVTVKTTSKNKQKVMPLELKTGRASFSAEHRGQVILYTMMMSELGKTVDSGLLLYLREGVMKEVQVGTVERRDLMLLRNQLVTKLKASHRVVIGDSLQITAPVLPRPIHHHSACAKCPYLTLCSAALKVSGSDDISESNPLHGLSVTSTDHLLMEHILYVFHWTGLLRLEHTNTYLTSPALHDIWTLPPAVRKKRGTCLPGVRLVSAVTEVTAGSYEHVFEWNTDTYTETTSTDTSCGFSEGDYVIVSSCTRPAVAAGCIRHSADNQLTLYLERDLSIRQKEEKIWYLDKYESQTGLVFNMTNLGSLLDNTEQACRLRKAVIELDLPVFSPKLSSRVLKAGADLLDPLNEQQRKAIFRALAADHYILIKGMPGTGKTATIVALIKLAVRLGNSVLITSHTHSAVDNVLLRLRGHVDFLRLGSAHKLHPELTKYGETSCIFNSPEEINAYYNSKNVVAVTCLGSSHPLLTRRQFDICLVDEATQVLQPTVLRPLFSARKFILIGDPNQLPPLVRSSQAKELGLGQSLFMRLDRPAVTSELSLQYRMNQRITEIANKLTYAGKLECGTPAVASATLTLHNPISEQPQWVVRALSRSLDHSVVVLDTGVTQAINKCVNHVEADIIMQLLTALNKAGRPDECVGVIAPYRAQVELLRKRKKALNSLVEVNTVDQFQGRDKDIILYSCSRSEKPRESDILGDKNRFTVAITRARHKLIIIGNVSLLRGYALFNTLFQSLSNDCIISVF